MYVYLSFAHIRTSNDSCECVVCVIVKTVCVIVKTTLVAWYVAARVV